MEDHARRGARRIGAVLAVAVVVAAGVLVSLVSSPDRADAATTLVVDSPAWGGQDATPGDGLCRTTAGTCTLRAAIEESNALNLPAGELTITVDPSVPVGGLTGALNYTTNRMLSTAISYEDTGGAMFHVTAPVTIDLGHRLQADGSATDGAAAMFYLNGPDIRLLNADLVRGVGETGIVVGPDARDVVVDGGGGQINTDNSYYPERFMVIREGVQGLTVRGYAIRGFWDSVTSGGVFVFNSLAPYTPRSDIAITDIDVLYNSGTACGASDGSGCRTRLTNFVPWNPANNVTNGLSFTRMHVQNMTTQNAFSFANSQDWTGGTSVSISDLEIADNVFVNNVGRGTGEANPFIMLPLGGHLTGETHISRNVFSRATSGQTYAIYYAEGTRLGDDSTADSTVASQVYIEDNYFNGYTANSIRVFQSGLVTVAGNAFGTRSGSQARPGIVEEYDDGGPVMLNTYHGIVDHSANQGIRTWYPSSAAAVLTAAPAAGVAVADDPRDGAVPTCLAQVPVVRGAGTDNDSQPAGQPVTLDVFWTADRTAELHVGRVSGITGDAATIAFPLPVGDIALPDGTARAVDPGTGAVSGYVRLQTHVEGLGQLESSQYSRVVAVSGGCRPALTLEQAAGQSDPTLGRDLRFTLTSSMPLDSGTVTADDITVTAAPVTTGDVQTIDATRLNPRVVDVSAIDGSGGLQFEVVVQVDDTAAVSVALPAGTVAAPSGLTNQDAAASVDAQVTYLNPVRVAPRTFPVVTGEARGEDVVISLAPDAPLPIADLVFAGTVAQPDGTPLVTASPEQPVIPAGESEAPTVTVRAAAGDVAANTATRLSYVLTSDDAQYDGLVVPELVPRLFATDPALRIERDGYVGMTDESSPETIVATGQPAPSGSRLKVGQRACFVFTVTNVSQDDWATVLTNIEVGDTDERLGAEGHIGTIPALGIGEQTQLAECTTLASVDTTANETTADDPIDGGAS
ncbi:hypothetical protein [Microbacterium sp. NPDC096154]|uniref:hypothetical protein n=1 Tax=Microbacterium sp. NPDC096154 TaxID=3155549 RepID=UPI003324B00F